MTLEPAKLNFVIWEGGTFHEHLELYDGETARNLTGYTGELIIRDRKEGTPLLTLTTGSGGVTFPATPVGSIDLLITDEVTSVLTWQHGVYDLVITSPGGVADPLLYGSFTVKGI